MKVRFNIEYRTQWGQKMMICGSLPQLGNWNEQQAVAMFPKNPEKGQWDLEIEVDNSKDLNFEYKYFIYDEQHGVRMWEWGENRFVSLEHDAFSRVETQDFWRNTSDAENALFSSAFTRALLRPKKHSNRKRSFAKLAKDSCVMRFQINVSRIEPHHRVGISGSTDDLGKWNHDDIVLMENSHHPLWTADVKIPLDEFPVFYKYCIYDTVEKRIVLWEGGENRYVGAPEEGSRSLTLRTDAKFNFTGYPWKGAGVAVPVFSIRTRDSWGVGEFLDIKKLVDWSNHTGMKLIQILPINDTVATHTWVDSYPYAGISVFGLHPMYLNLPAIGKLASTMTQEVLEEQGRLLNQLDRIDYEGVMRVKSAGLKLLYDDLKTQFFADEEYKAFFEQNKSWLVSYAAFSYLRDLYGTPEFSRWGRFAKCTPELLAEVTDPAAPHYDHIAIHYFIQYHLHLQLLEASEYARSKGIVLKGDIPIGIYRNSVDAWVAPQLYNMFSQAGAPPDDFSDKGQNWRFPTYNWEEMSKDGYLWWKQRLQKMSEYFDAFRIDHILGFFRIWEIDHQHIEGLLGYFNPALTLHRNEITDRGIPFDYFRYCRPYIREHMLGGLFGELTQHIKEKYLVEYEPMCYHLAPEYDTQRKIEDHLKLGVDATHEERARNEKIKNGLFYLLSEVLFLDAPFSNGERFNPRHSMSKTWSFNDLDGETRRKLQELYVDYFYKRNESFWRENAMKKLPSIKNATNMLICGEDLGMVPDCVPAVMNELGMLSLEVQRMPKNPKIQFGHPADYPYLSVATPSSHDTSTIRGWWEEDTTRSQKFFNQILGKWGNSPFYCEPWIVRDIVVQHLYSPSMWAIFPIQDLVGMDGTLRADNAKSERINEPANPQHYWRYRFHLDMEDLMQQEELNTLIRNMVTESGRNRAY